MGRGSTSTAPMTRTSTSSTPHHSSSSSNVAPFDDEENFILSVLISMHEEILGNTASAGPALDAKNRVWHLITDRLRNKIGGIQRSEEQVKARWRSMRSAYSFKVDKPRNIAETFYKKFKDSPHRVRTSDITVNGVKFPPWLNNLIKNDVSFKTRDQESPPPPLLLQSSRTSASTSSKRLSLKRPSTITTASKEEEEKETPERKRTRTTRNSTMPKLVSQYPPSELSALRVNRSVKDERRKSAANDSVSPTSGAPDEYNSVTESGTNSPIPCSVFWEETEYEIRRRREEELHQAKLALLRSQTQEANAKTKLTKLQIEALVRGGSTSTPPPSSDTVSIETDFRTELTPFDLLLESTNQNAEF